MNKTLHRTTDQRTSLLKQQAASLFWYGRIETTAEKAKALSSYAEKILTKAINTYTDVVAKEEIRKNAKGQPIKVKVYNDGPKKLSARRSIMASIQEIPEMRGEEEKYEAFKARTKSVKHPLVEKLFNELAPKYAKRAEDVGNYGGYTRVLKLGPRRGDNAEMALIELV